MADETVNGSSPNGHAQHSGGAHRVRPAGAGRDAWAVDGFAPLPGDTVSLPGDEHGLVETVYLCAEPDTGDATRWTWIVLADSRLLEVAPRGCALYDPPQVLAQGTGPYLELVAQDGALVRFEERVREGIWEARPVRLALGGRRWRVTSTGIVTSQRLGPPPVSAWGQLGQRDVARHARFSAPRGNPGDVLPRLLGEGGSESPPSPDEPDVYFTFAGQGDADALGLGLWATDVILVFGRRLGASPASAGLRVREQEPSP